MYNIIEYNMFSYEITDNENRIWHIQEVRGIQPFYTSQTDMSVKEEVKTELKERPASHRNLSYMQAKCPNTECQDARGIRIGCIAPYPPGQKGPSIF